ncbi:TOBE domain-containing protein [Floridanema evergladense]|uniref:Molybdopterin-binding protein n=1 Tax=Floridaenema evergladense BLCC-F167 TaxID=3153639 RepID=A0ABV4WGG5_9CYAN
MPRKEQGWITFQSSEEERNLLEQYCQESQRSKTEVLRELVRSLTQQWQKVSQNSPSVIQEKPTVPSTYQVLGISARNNIRGKVKQVLIGDITAEVIVEIAPNVEIVSVITKSSVERFAIAPGKEVCVVIKSSDVMIAVEQ